MAVSLVVAHRYAEAIFAAARDAGEIDAVERDLGALNEMIERSPQMLDVLHNPLIPGRRKGEIVDRILSGAVQPVTLRLMHLLIEKRRTDVLPYLYDLYVGMANEHRGVLPAFVTSAVPLLPAEVEALTARLSAMTGKRILLRTEVNTEMIGGMRVQVGDTVIDGTVVGYLRQLHGKLKEVLA